VSVFRKIIIKKICFGLDAIRFDRTEDYNFKKSRAKYPESFSTFDIESLLNCVEEGTQMVTSLVDGSLSEGQSRSFYNPSTRSKLKSFEDMTHKTHVISDQSCSENIQKWAVFVL
jgi:hypothetical protein